jgi:hypothetical protein
MRLKLLTYLRLMRTALTDTLTYIREQLGAARIYLSNVRYANIAYALTLGIFVILPLLLIMATLRLAVSFLDHHEGETK